MAQGTREVVPLRTTCLSTTWRSNCTVRWSVAVLRVKHTPSRRTISVKSVWTLIRRWTKEQGNTRKERGRMLPQYWRGRQAMEERSKTRALSSKTAMVLDKEGSGTTWRLEQAAPGILHCLGSAIVVCMPPGRELSQIRCVRCTCQIHGRRRQLEDVGGTASRSTRHSCSLHQSVTTSEEELCFLTNQPPIGQWWGCVAITSGITLASRRRCSQVKDGNSKILFPLGGRGSASACVVACHISSAT